MKKKSKLSLKKITLLSLDDAHLIRGGDGCDTCDAGGDESYCGGCPTMHQEDSGCCCSQENTGCATPTNTPSCETCQTQEQTCAATCEGATCPNC